MIKNKKARIRGMVFFILALALFSYLIISTENIGLEDQINLTLPVEETNNSAGEGTALPEEAGNSTVEGSDINNSSDLENNQTAIENLTEEPDLLETEGLAGETEEIFTEVESGKPELIYDEKNYSISYRMEIGGNKTRIYPSFVFDFLEFTNLDLTGKIILADKGDLERFVSVFVIDTSLINFTEGQFTKRKEGSALYKCLSWNWEEKNCNSEWESVKNIDEEEYSLQLEKGQVAYGELKSREAGLIAIQSTYNTSQADGLIVYSESTINAPRYRTWNSSINNFSGELTDMQDTGGDTKWAVLEAASRRDEIMAGTENDQQQVQLQIYNSSRQWGNYLIVSTGVPNTGQRAFDLAYEEISGEALVAYENSGSNGDAVFAYRSWNGTGYSTEQNFTTTLTSNAFSWVELVPQKGTDIIMTLVHNGAGDLFAVPWNGTAFESDKQQILSEATTSNTEQHFAFAWGEFTGHGLVGYGEGNNFVYRTYSPTAPYWSEEATIGIGNGLGALRMCSKPNSDYIGIIWQDGGNDINVRVWDGSQILDSPPSEDAQTEASGANNINIDCAWFNSSTALFGFVDFGANAIDYFTFTQTNTWSTGVLTSTDSTSNFATGDIKGLHFVKHPSTVEIMALAEDDAEDLHIIRWNGTNFTLPTTYTLEANVEVLDAAQEDARFAWFRYDSAPTVSIISPAAGQIFNVSMEINITVSVTDNFNASAVSANISWPNGSISQSAMSDHDNDGFYNTTFNGTGYGSYAILVIANDTNNNYNTAARTFLMADANNKAPNAILNYPANSSNLSLSRINFNWSAIDTTDVNLTCNLTVNGAVNASNIYSHNGTAINYSVAGFAEGSHQWNMSCWDPTKTINISVTRIFTVDTIYPTIQFAGPSTSSGNYSLSYLFANITASDTNLAIINITLYNASGLVNSTFNRTSPFFVNFTSLTDGTYYLNATANDTAGNLNYTGTRTIVLDTISPTVNLVAPTNNTLEQTSNLIVFVYNITDITSGIKNCSLFINDSSNETDTTVTKNTNQSFAKTLVNKNYNWSIKCYDDTGNLGSSVVYNLSVSVNKPTVMLDWPVNGYNSSSSSLVFNCSAIDDSALVNLTLIIWNRTGSLAYSKTSSVSGISSSSSLTAALTANQNYSWNCEAYDNAGLADSADSNWTLTIDTTYPAIQFASPSTSSGNYSLSYLFVNISVSDNVLKLINITLYNSTELVNSTASSASLLFVNFTGLAEERYYLNATVADGAGNINYSETRAIVLDRTAPNIALNSQINGYNSSSRTVVFNFTATDNLQITLNCSVYINGTSNQTEAAVSNGTAKTFSVTGLVDGDQTWNISCLDSAGNLNTSETRNLTIDTQKPAFQSLTTSPSAANELDPGVNVTVKANVTDNITGINLVILQRKLSSASDYTNLTLSFNATSGFYEGIFNASSSGTYNLKLWANDSAGNSDFSNIVNITVEYDYTWSRTPSSFTISADSNQKTTLGNLTINNTGDYVINFTITSNSSTTAYNETENFTLAAGEVKQIMINETAPAGGIKVITLTVRDNQSTPDSQTVTGTIVAAGGQPVLLASFIIPSSDTLSVTQKETGIEFLARLRNIGTGNASNVTFFIILPSDWTIMAGDLNQTYDSLTSGETVENLIEVSIPANASTGEKWVVANATAYNASGVNLTSLNLIFEDKINVTISALTTLGAVVTTTTGTTSSTTTSGGGGVGGGAGGVGGTSLLDLILSGEEVVSSTERVDLTRGYSGTFPLSVKNIFDGMVLKNVRLNVEGYLSKYLEVSPQSISEIPFGESKEFTVKVISPEYMEAGKYELMATITGELVGKKDWLGRKVEKELKESREIVLVVHAFTKEEVDQNLEEALGAIEELEKGNLPISGLKEKLLEAQQALQNKDYEGAYVLAQAITQAKEEAFQADSLLKEVEDKIKLSQSLMNGLFGIQKKYFETENLLFLAKAALERGDYQTALQRAKDAQLTLAIEANEFKLLFFLIDYWWLVLIMVFFTFLIAFYGYRIYLLVIASKKIKELAEEELLINKLIKQTQIQHFQKKKIGPTTFKRNIEQYQKRLSKVKQLRIELRHKRAALLKPKKLFFVLGKEREEVLSSLKKLQSTYFIKGKVSKADYEEQNKVYQERLAEIEDEQLTLETKSTRKPKITKTKDKLKIAATAIVLIALLTGTAALFFTGSSSSLTGAAVFSPLNNSLDLTVDARNNLSKAEAGQAISEAEGFIAEMAEAGLAANSANDSLTAAKTALKRAEFAELIRKNATGKLATKARAVLEGLNYEGFTYDEVLKYTNEVKLKKNKAFFLLDSIKALEIKKEEYQKQSTDVIQAEALLEQAKQAFASERYDETKEFLEKVDAELEEKRAEVTTFNVILNSGKSFFVKNWIEIIAVLAVLSVSIGLSFVKIRKKLIKKKIEKLKDEKSSLIQLIKKSQEERFQEGKLSNLVYNIRMEKYNQRLNEIKHTLPILEASLKKKEKTSKTEGIGKTKKPVFEVRKKAKKGRKKWLIWKIAGSLKSLKEKLIRKKSDKERKKKKQVEWRKKEKVKDKVGRIKKKLSDKIVLFKNGVEKRRELRKIREQELEQSRKKRDWEKKEEPVAKISTTKEKGIGPIKSVKAINDFSGDYSAAMELVFKEPAKEKLPDYSQAVALVFKEKEERQEKPVLPDYANHFRFVFKEDKAREEKQSNDYWIRWKEGWSKQEKSSLPKPRPVMPEDKGSLINSPAKPVKDSLILKDKVINKESQRKEKSADLEEDKYTLEKYGFKIKRN